MQREISAVKCTAAKTGSKMFRHRRSHTKFPSINFAGGECIIIDTLYHNDAKEKESVGASSRVQNQKREFKNKARNMNQQTS